MSIPYQNLTTYPGGDLVSKGLTDLAAGLCSEEALLVMVAGPRLRDLGFTIRNLETVSSPFEHALYNALELRLPRGAYAAYNALIQCVASFANAYAVANRRSFQPKMDCE